MTRMRRTRALVAVVIGLVLLRRCRSASACTLAAVLTDATRPWRPGPPRSIAYTSWDTAAELRRRHAPRAPRSPTASCVIGSADRHDVARRQVRRRARWTSPWVVARLRADRAGAVVGRRARPSGTLVQVEVRGRSRGRHARSWDTLGRWAARRRRRSGAPASAARPTTSPASTIDTWVATDAGFTLAGSCGSRLLRRRRHDADPAVEHGRRDGLARCRDVDSVDHLEPPGVAPRHGARRAALLPDGARRRVPAVRRRRRGLVLADLDVDGARLLRRGCRPRRTYAWVRPVVRRPRGSTTPRG